MPIVKQSRYVYADTVARLLKAITDAGNTVFATIDQAAAAKQSGLTMRPTSLIVFGNPKGGTPLMDAFPLVALDLPLKIAVWEHDGIVSVAYTSAKELAARYAITSRDTLIEAIDHALDAISDSVGTNSN